MMNDKEFFELHLRATILPQQVGWPAPELPHWQRLHEAANEARARVRKTYLLMDEIDQNAKLSRDDKHRQCSTIVAEAIEDFDSSRALARAREAVELTVIRRNCEQHILPEMSRDSEAMLKAMNELEQGWQKGIDKISERAGRVGQSRFLFRARS